jgi:hypothetical protein
MSAIILIFPKSRLAFGRAVGYTVRLFQALWQLITVFNPPAGAQSPRLDAQKLRASGRSQRLDLEFLAEPFSPRTSKTRPPPQWPLAQHSPSQQPR